MNYKFNDFRHPVLYLYGVQDQGLTYRLLAYPSDAMARTHHPDHDMYRYGSLYPTGASLYDYPMKVD